MICRTHKIQSHHLILTFIILQMIQNNQIQSIPSQHPYLKTIHHSSNIIAASRIKLYFNNRDVPSMVFAKSTSLQFYFLIDNTPVYSHTIQLHNKITAMNVIPTRHKWADSIFIADSLHRLTIYRPTTSKGLQILLRRTCQFESLDEGKPEIHSGVNYIFNANDTQGYLYYSFESDLVTIGFSDKSSGFIQISNTSTHLGNTILSVTSISKTKSRFKKQTIGVVCCQSNKYVVRIFDLQLNPYESKIKICKQDSIILNIHAGNQFIVVDPFEIHLYSYDFGGQIAAFKQPFTNCISKVVDIQNVYCGIGSQLMIFNRLGKQLYGDYQASDAAHLENNLLITWHQTQNTKMIQLLDNKFELIKEWVNLGPISEINVLSINGTQTYVVNSPLKRKPISILSQSISYTSIIKDQLSSTVKKVFTSKHKQQAYVWIVLYNNISILTKVKNNIIEETMTLENFEVLETYQNYVIAKDGIYHFDGGCFKHIHFNQPINRASINAEGMVVLQIAHQRLEYFNINQPDRRNQIKIQKELSALYYYGYSIYFCYWGTRKLQIVNGIQYNKLKLQSEAKSIFIKNNCLYIGYSEGRIQLFDLGTMTKMYQFKCGTTPVRNFVQNESKVFAFSNKSCCISECSLNVYTKKDVLLQNISGFVPLSSGSILITYKKTIQLIKINRSQNVNIQQLNILQGDIKICSFNQKLFVLTPFRAQIYNFNSNPISEFHHQFSSIKSRIEVFNDSFILVAGKISIDYAVALFDQFSEKSRLQLKKSVSTICSFSKSHAVLGLNGQLKFISVQDSIIDLFSVGIDIIPYSIDVLPQHNKLIVGDTVRSLLLCSYNLQKRSVITLSRFGMASLSLQARFLGEYILQSDDRDNLFLLSGRLSSQNQLQRVSLGFNGGVNLCQSVWSMQKNKKNNDIVYATNRGSIGKISLINNEEYLKLSQLQQVLIRQRQKGISYKESKNIKVFGKKVDMTHNSLINGDLVKEITRMDNQECISVFGQLGCRLDGQELKRMVQRIDNSA